MAKNRALGTLEMRKQDRMTNMVSLKTEKNGRSNSRTRRNSKTRTFTTFVRTQESINFVEKQNFRKVLGLDIR